MLYITATPIGNLQDITLRALEVLKQVEYIACENMQHTATLLNYFELKAKLLSYREESRERDAKRILSLLSDGHDVALVTDAGTPTISDPGYHLVALALEHGVEVTSLPGASAVLTAISLSGFTADSFLFLGFPPRKSSNRAHFFSEIAESEHTTVFYESPHKLLKTLKELEPLLHERKMLAARELTKRFEELSRGTVSELLQRFGSLDPKGEFVFVVEGKKKAARKSVDPALIEELLNSGLSPKDVVRELSSLSSSKKELYAAVLEVKKRMS